MKQCTKCKIEYPKTLEYFPPSKQNKDSFKSWCRKCSRKAIIEAKLKKLDYYKEQHKQATKVWGTNNKEKIKIKNEKWRKKNPINQRFQSNIRKSYIKQATPKNNEIRKQLKELKKKCPKKYHIHHIIPIKEQKEIIMGLNVPWNIKIVSEKEHKELHNAKIL